MENQNPSENTSIISRSYMKIHVENHSLSLKKSEETSKTVNSQHFNIVLHSTSSGTYSRCGSYGTSWTTWPLEKAKRASSRRIISNRGQKRPGKSTDVMDIYWNLTIYNLTYVIILYPYPCTHTHTITYKEVKSIDCSIVVESHLCCLLPRNRPKERWGRRRKIFATASGLDAEKGVLGTEQRFLPTPKNQAKWWTHIK